MNDNLNNNDSDDLLPDRGKQRAIFGNKIKYSNFIIFAGIIFAAYFVFNNYHLGYKSNGIELHQNGYIDIKEEALVNNDGEANLEKKTEENKVTEYEVKSGDTIWGIAGKYELTTKELLEINKLTEESVIKPGQKIVLPTGNEDSEKSSPVKQNYQVQAVFSENSPESGKNNLEDADSSEQKPFDYEVESGDTISIIAQRYNLKINTILWANGLSARSVIKPGQKLVLLPVDGVLHKVQKGDIIGKIAVLHKADAQKIMDYNEISDPTKIYPGDMIIVPDGQPIPPAPKPSPAPKSSAVKPAAEDVGKAATDISRVNPSAEKSNINLTAKLLWPTSVKRITQGYKTKHRGIDIANGGTPPIYASHSGTVEFAGKSGAWGNTILLRRDDGLLTRYSHASTIYVIVGQNVNAGDTVGIVGNTGRSTGNHLDFRVYVNGIATNPMKFF